MKHLTQRELEVVRFIVKGKTHKEIAKSLQLSTNTIKNHIASVKNKWHISRNTELVRMAIENKI